MVNDKQAHAVDLSGIDAKFFSITRSYCSLYSTSILLFFILLFYFLNPVHAAENGSFHSSSGEGIIKKALDVSQPELVEKTGQYIPLDLLFTDENGNSVALSSLIDRPSLLLPVYYSCPSACPLQLANLAQVVNKVLPQAGKDYKIIAFSFDDQDNAAKARHAKDNYSKLLDKDFPQGAWSYLVGDKESITTLTNSIGYTFKKIAPHQFVHPNVLICVDGDGQIIRYIYGPDFLSFDLSMAIGEAEKGIPGVSIRKLINYCFSYDPGNKKYVFNIFRVLGISSLCILVLFYLLVLRKGNRSRKNRFEND